MPVLSAVGTMPHIGVLTLEELKSELCHTKWSHIRELFQSNPWGGGIGVEIKEDWLFIDNY